MKPLKDCIICSGDGVDATEYRDEPCPCLDREEENTSNDHVHPVIMEALRPHLGEE